jgi:hypothetical protein
MDQRVKTFFLLLVVSAATLGGIKVKNTEKSLSITTEEKLAGMMPSSITWSFGPSSGSPQKRIVLHNDGRVEVFGDFDESTLLFWKTVTKQFPDFKKSICEKKK